MAADDKKSKTDPAPKKEVPPKKETTSKNESPSVAEPSTVEGSETAAASPANYSRGEGQKPVTKAYKENWNAIFAKKKKKR